MSRPSCVQFGTAAYSPSADIRLGNEPLDPMTQISVSPPSWMFTAIRPPSGDQTGKCIIPRSMGVIRWGVPDPSAFITKSAGPPSPRLMKTILLPSGDQFGVHGEDPDGPAASATGECDPLAIGGPHRPTVDPVERREEPHLGAVGVHDVKLVDSVGITQEYDLAEYEDLRSGARSARRHSDRRTALAPYAGHEPGRIHASHDRVRGRPCHGDVGDLDPVRIRCDDGELHRLALGDRLLLGGERERRDDGADQNGDLVRKRRGGRLDPARSGTLRDGP